MQSSLPNLKKLTETLFVHSVLVAQDMKKVAEAGFKSVIINLPDFELGESQATASEVMIAAKANGLDVIYQPVITSEITEKDCATFHENLSKLPAPTLAFCRSGNRCSILFNGVTQ